MLDHLDTLDDATPIEPDAAMLAGVRGRADRLRRRNRLAIVGAVVIPLVIAAGVAALNGGQTQHVDVTTPPAPNSQLVVSEGTLPNGLHVRMTLETPTVQVGDDLRAQVVVTNDTEQSKDTGVGILQCRFPFGPVLRDGKGRIVTDGRNVVCPDSREKVKLPAGGSVSLTTLIETQSASLPPEQLRGQYELRLEMPAMGSPGKEPGVSDRSIGPVSVELVAPDVTAHLEVPTPTVHPGDEIDGHVVFDNRASSPVQASCGSRPYSGADYQVFLSVDGVALEPAQASVGHVSTDSGCGTGGVVLPPGITRVPFTLVARYYDCSSAGNTPPDAPRCAAGNTIPPLAPRQYQIRFRGIGPLASIAVAPVAIQVVAAPAK